MAVEGPFGGGLQTSGSGGHAAKKGRITLRRSRFRLLLVVALIITGTAETSGFMMIPDSALNWAIQQLDALQNISLQPEDGFGANRVCNTSDCVLAANHLLLGMNETANPCDDFYEYACGNWVKLSKDQGLEYNSHSKQMAISELKLLEEILLRQPDSITFEPAKAAAMVYRQCLNGSEAETRENMDTIIGLIAKLSGWPSLEGPDWNENAFDLEDTLAFIFREYFQAIFFRLTVVPHGVKETTYVIKLNLPTLISEDKLENKTYTTVLKIFYGATLCQDLGYNSKRCDYTVSWAHSLGKDADKLMQLYKDLKLAATTTPQEHSNITNIQTIFTVAEFQKYLDKYFDAFGDKYSNETSDEDLDNIRGTRISWKGLLNKIFGPLQVEINDDQVLVVDNPSYFMRLPQILNATPKRTIANYVLYSLILPQLLQTSPKIYQFVTTYSLNTDQKFYTWDTHCLSKTMGLFAVPVMHEYLKTKSNLEDRAVLEQISENFRAHFDKILESNTWLADETKLAVRKKLRALKFLIGYPNWLLNATEIEGRFERRPLGSNSIETLVNVLKLKRAKELRNLGKSPPPPAFVESYADKTLIFKICRGNL